MKTIAIIGGGAAGLAAAVAAAEAVRAGVGEAAAETVRGVSDGVSVVVYEASDRVGRSILATGNGRCNFSNADVTADVYRNPGFVGDALLEFEAEAQRRLPAADRSHPQGVLDFFAAHGLLRREEGEGRLYPLANKATSVLDCLRAAAAATGVEERPECEVVRVEAPRGPGGRFTLRLVDGRFERADRVIVAVGGTIARDLLPDGVPWTHPEPTLGPLATETRWAKMLDNIRVRGALSLWRADKSRDDEPPVGLAGNGGRGLVSPCDVERRGDDLVVPTDTFCGVQRKSATANRFDDGDSTCRDRRQEDGRGDDHARLEELSRRGLLPEWHEGESLVAVERGEVMFRKYGLSGIAAFNMSRLARPGDVLAVDFLPAVREVDAAAFLNRRRKVLRASLGRAVTWDDMLRGMVLTPVADVLLKASGLRGDAEVAKGDTARMAPHLKALRFPVTGLGDPRQCQVHRGGVAVEAMDGRSCEVRAVPGLFVVGEALDVDAPCGGYNLHWAWASGLLAGWRAAASLVGEGADKSDVAGMRSTEVGARVPGGSSEVNAVAQGDAVRADGPTSAEGGRR